MGKGEWGLDGWGVGPWGGIAGEESFTVATEPITENCLRLTFPQALYFTGLQDLKDTGNVEAHFLISGVVGSVGLDEQEVREVTALIADPVDGDPNSVDLYVDRPFSHFPAQYVVQCKNIYAASGSLYFSSKLVVFYGLQKTFENPDVNTYKPAGTRDFANPSNEEAVYDPLPQTDDSVLGTYAYGDDGDYAHDEGAANLKKRVLRRCIVRKGGFVWLPKYGVGIGDELKRLNSQARRERIRAEMESQISEEPDIARVKVSLRYLPDTPGIVWFVIKVITATRKAYQFAIPFDATLV